jgi:nitrate reductase assembly molybdenum cofactor insertion protein NarJ
MTLGVARGNRRLRRASYHGLRECVEALATEPLCDLQVRWVRLFNRQLGHVFVFVFLNQDSDNLHQRSECM